jgi:hypothetical protein
VTDEGTDRPPPLQAEVWGRTAEDRNREQAARAARSGFGGESVRYGVTMGCALAMVISYTRNESVLWAIVHGFLSWVYVIFHVIFH